VDKTAVLWIQGVWSLTDSAFLKYQARIARAKLRTVRHGTCFQGGTLSVFETMAVNT